MKANNYIQELKERISQLDSETLTLDQKAVKMQEMLDDEEERGRVLEKKMKAIREVQFKSNQNLFELKGREKSLENSIKGSQSALKNMKTKAAKLDRDSLKQRVMIYAMDFSIQQLERKLRRAEGERSDEEKEILESKIEVLQVKYQEVNAKHTLLNTQLKRSQEGMRHFKRRMENAQKDKDLLTTQITDLDLFTQSTVYP